eukprot:scaffold434_cov186-Pinguiococcus_pyrenoidosus.AAC.110
MESGVDVAERHRVMRSSPCEQRNIASATLLPASQIHHRSLPPDLSNYTYTPLFPIYARMYRTRRRNRSSSIL